jgi:hypothetical protein
MINTDIHRYIPMYIGCGRSEGEYVSLGVFEKDDLLCALRYLDQVVYMYVCPIYVIFPICVPYNCPEYSATICSVPSATSIRLCI